MRAKATALSIVCLASAFLLPQLQPSPRVAEARRIVEPRTPRPVPTPPTTVPAPPAAVQPPPSPLQPRTPRPPAVPARVQAVQSPAQPPAPQIDTPPAPPLVAEPEADIPDRWLRLADCESGKRTKRNGRWVPIPGSRRWGYKGGGFQGGLQFHPRTWGSHKAEGDPGHAGDATPRRQVEAGERVLASQGRGAWPNCWRYAGL